MEINYIKEFISLAETESLLDSAEMLQMTTSSLSRHIKVLEDELGFPLFDRNTRKMLLNQRGKLFLSFARKFAQVDEECRQMFQMDQPGAQRTLNVGTIPLMAAYGILDLVSDFQKKHPNIVLHLEERESRDLPALLLNGKCDLAFLRERDDPDGFFTKMPFITDRLAAVMPQNHPLAQEPFIRIEQLRDEPLLLIGKNAFLYKICLDLCKKAGFAPQVAFASHRADNLINIAKKGGGIALLMEKPATNLISDTLCIVPIRPEVTTQIYLAYSPHHQITSEMMDFLDAASAMVSRNTNHK